MEGVETRYAATETGKIAYQLVGDGPIDVIVEPRPWLPIDLMWDEPRMVRFVERLSRFCRQVWFDPRGRGASDPLPPHGRSVEFVVEDIVQLLDHVGWREAAVIGLAGTHETLLAATHPERVTALVLVEPAVRYRRAENYPEGWDDETVENLLSTIEQNWGTGANLQLYAPALADDRRLAQWFARCERMAMSPSEAALRYRAAWDADLRDVLSTITVPTLVVEGATRLGHGASTSSNTSRDVAESRVPKPATCSSPATPRPCSTASRNSHRTTPSPRPQQSSCHNPVHRRRRINVERRPPRRSPLARSARRSRHAHP